MINTDNPKQFNPKQELKCFAFDRKTLINNSKPLLRKYIAYLRQKQSNPNKISIGYLGINVETASIMPFTTNFYQKYHLEAPSIRNKLFGVRSSYTLIGKFTNEQILNFVLKYYLHWYYKELKKQRQLSPLGAIKLLNSNQAKSLFSDNDFTDLIVSHLETINGEMISAYDELLLNLDMKVLTVLPQIRIIKISTINALFSIFYHEYLQYSENKPTIYIITLVKKLFDIMNDKTKVKVIYDEAADFNCILPLAKRFNIHSLIVPFNLDLWCSSCKDLSEYLQTNHLTIRLKNKQDLNNAISDYITINMWGNKDNRNKKLNYFLPKLKLLIASPNLKLVLNKKAQFLIKNRITNLKANHINKPYTQCVIETLNFLLEHAN